jgi:hypothetical protein
MTPELKSQVNEVIAWLQSIQEVATTTRLEKAGHVVIRATSNSKVLASLIQGGRQQ